MFANNNFGWGTSMYVFGKLIAISGGGGIFDNFMRLVNSKVNSWNSGAWKSRNLPINCLAINLSKLQPLP